MRIGKSLTILCSVLSGVSHGSCFGQWYFVYLIHLVQAIQDSKIKMFADEVQLYRGVSLP